MRELTCYRSEGAWAFDDPAVDLQCEPFVLGTSELLDALRAEHGIETPTFNLQFSDRPFPEAQATLVRLGKENDGVWYGADIAGKFRTGWLCPALFKYFSVAPIAIYVRAQP